MCAIGCQTAPDEAQTHNLNKLSALISSGTGAYKCIVKLLKIILITKVKEPTKDKDISVLIYTLHMVKFQLLIQSLLVKSPETKAMQPVLLVSLLVLIKHRNKFEDALFPITQFFFPVTQMTTFACWVIHLGSLRRTSTDKPCLFEWH